MTILKAVSTEKGFEGQILDSSKKSEVVNGKMNIIYLSEEQLRDDLQKRTYQSFEIVEWEI